MNISRVFILVVLLVLTASCDVLAQPMTQDAFEENLYGVSEISHFGIEKARFDELTTSQREGVLRAKGVLLGLLKALQDKNGKTEVYLTDALNKKYPSKRSFAQSLVDDETSLIGLLVTDFTIAGNGKRVELSFSVVASSEGMIVTASKKAVLVAAGLSWKLAEIS